MADKTQQVPKEMRRAHGRFERYRKAHTGRRPIPETLWNMAANWVPLGHTTGRGKDDQTHRVNRSIKEVLAFPLHRRFRCSASQRNEAGDRADRTVHGRTGETAGTRARVEPLPEEDYWKLKAAVDTLEYSTELVADKDTTIRHLRQLLLPTAEKTKAVLEKIGIEPAKNTPGQTPAENGPAKAARPRPGHGRNSFAGESCRLRGPRQLVSFPSSPCERRPRSGPPRVPCPA
jgi:hypothetical protein